MRPESAYPILVAILLAVACADVTTETEETGGVGPGAPEPGRPRRPIPQGFTQQPRPSSGKLPPPPAPLLTAQEEEAARRDAVHVSTRERERAQEALGRLLDQMEKLPQGGPATAWERSRDQLRRAVIPHLRAGRVLLTSSAKLCKDYLFPNDPDEADRTYKGRIIVLSATVVPHNIADIADIYKVFEQEPYVHRPLLLQTDYELTFVRCQLLRAEHQKLADWQPIYLLGVVEGKVSGDVRLSRCVVL